jgi:hypothetical protein
MGQMYVKSINNIGQNRQIFDIEEVSKPGKVERAK